MPLTKPRRSLYVAGQGEVVIDEKDVTLLNRRELQMLAWLHEWAAKEQVNIFCKQCEQPIRGQNNDSDPTAAPRVACQCREWIYRA